MMILAKGWTTSVCTGGMWTDCGKGYTANRAGIAFLVWAICSILVILKVFLGKDRR